LAKVDLANCTSSFLLFKEALEEGDTAAALPLGKQYYHGNGVPVDYNQAFRCLSISAANGEVGGLYLLAQCYRLGQGTEQNLPQAISYLLIAANHSDSNALRLLKTLGYRF